MLACIRGISFSMQDSPNKLRNSVRFVSSTGTSSTELLTRWNIGGPRGEAQFMKNIQNFDVFNQILLYHFPFRCFLMFAISVAHEFFSSPTCGKYAVFGT